MELRALLWAGLNQTLVSFIDEVHPWVLCTHHSVFSVQMKNCDPLVFAPAFAMDKIPEEPTCKIGISAVSMVMVHTQHNKLQVRVPM